MHYILNWFKTSLIKRTLLSLKNYVRTLWMMRQTSFMAPDLFLSRASHCSVEFEIRNISNFLRVPVLGLCKIWWFRFIVSQWAAVKFTKVESVPAELKLCSLNILFRDVLLVFVRCFSFFFCPLSKDLMNKTIAQHVRFKTVYIS